MSAIVAAVEQALSAIERHASLNAIVSCDAPAALRRAAELDGAIGARHPVHGLTLLVKDNIAAEGFAFTGGSPAFASFFARQSSAVSRMVEAGMVLLGKANLHELAFGVTSANAHTGFVRNPCDPTRVAGGSSGGSAAAVATGMARVSLVTDTGGSARIPAAFCGVLGLRPTTGRYPGDGIMTLSPTRDSLGLIAADLQELADVDALLAGEPTRPLQPPPTLRIGVPRKPYWEGLSDGMAAAGEAVLQALARDGIELVEIDARDITRIDGEIGMPIALRETWDTWRRFLPRALGLSIEAFVPHIASPDVRGLFEMMCGEHLPPESAYRAALQRLPELAGAYERALSNGVDALLMPTTVREAPTEDERDTLMLNGVACPTFPTLVRQTSPASLARVPSLTIPGGPLADGLPSGWMVEALPGRDRHLLDVAARLVAALGASSAHPRAT